LTLTLSPTAGKIGQVVGRAVEDGEYGGHCERDLVLFLVVQGGVAIVGHPSDSCTEPDAREIVLVRNGDTLEYKARNRGDPQFWIFASLTRSS
jgi:hypothetical protein